MTRLLAIFLLATMTGCTSIQQLWPRPHDPVLFDHLVITDIEIEHINCDQPDWSSAQRSAQVLARYAEWRRDPQADNLKGLLAHTERMSRGGSKAFCELGKKTGQQRIEAARSAWQGR